MPLKKKPEAVRKRPPKLPNKIQVIKNSEKDVGNWMERWNKPKNRSIGCLPHPFRLCALGGVGRGKSCTLKNLFLAHQSTHKPFKELYIVTCDASSTEWLDCEPTGIFDELPDITLFNPKKKTMLIIDDLELCRLGREGERNLSTLFRFVSSHRNVSIMVGYQSFFDVNTIIRKCSNVFILYKPNGSQEVSLIANRVGMEKEDLNHIFNHICNGTYDSLMVDFTIDSPYKLRKNVYQPIQMNDSDSDSDTG